MKLKNTILLFLFVLAGVINGLAQGIKFEHTSMEEIFQKAKNEKKLLFIDCYTQWCGPCKKLAKTVFIQDSVGDYFNTHFVNCKMDMETEQGKQIQKKYNVRAYPTLLWINTDGGVEHRYVGSCKAEKLITLGKIAKERKQSLGAYQRGFQAGKNDLAFLKQYLQELSIAGIETQEVSEILLKKITLKKVLTSENFSFLIKGVGSPKHPFFIGVMKQREDYYQLLGKEKTDNFLKRVLLFELFKHHKKPEFESTKKEYQNQYPYITKMVIKEMEERGL